MEIDLHGSVITGSVFDKVIKNGNEIHITVSPSPNSFLDNPDSVSYTHLTLPTNSLV